MAARIFVVKSPEGREYRVWARDQSEAIRRAQYAQSNPGEYDAESPEYQARFGATAGASGASLAAAGAGKSVVDLGRGLKQIGAEGASLVTRDPRVAEAMRAEMDEVAARDEALMSTGAGLAGNIGGTLATTLIPAAGIARGAQAVNLGRTAAAARGFVNPATYRAAVGAGALQGALQPVGSEGSRLENVAIGGATGTVGKAIAGAVGRIAQPIRRAASEGYEAAVRTLERAGVPLDAAQRSGSRAAAQVKRFLQDNPLTAPGSNSFFAEQGRAFTRAVLRTIGADSDAATSDVMSEAAERIGSTFDDIAARNTVKYDGELNAALNRVANQARNELPSNDYRAIANQVEEIFNKAQDGDGALIGQAYQNVRSSLGRMSATRSPLGHWAGELREALDDALTRSVSDADEAALRQARSQYRNMMQIEGAISTDGSGAISPARLANILGQRGNRRQSLYGRGDQTLVMLAQAGKRLLPDSFPNSGTTARGALQALGIVGGAGGLGALSTDDPLTGIGSGLALGGALLAGAPAMRQQALARYASGGLRPGVVRNALLLPGRVSAPNLAAIAALESQ